MDSEIKNSFIKYRLERAKEVLNTAEVIFDIKDYRSANNRAYYAIFYAIRAVLARKKILKNIKM